MTSQVAERILYLVDQQGEIQGVAILAEAIPCEHPAWVREQLRRLEEAGYLSYIPTRGGRGNRSVIRKRNRNSPGQSRRRSGQ